MNNFFEKFAKILNAEQSKSIIFSGNVYDLFFNGKDYVPLIPFLCKKTKVPGIIHILYELNGPITISTEGRSHLKKAWREWREGDVGQEDIDKMLSHRKSEPKERIASADSEFESRLRQSNGNSTLALEFLRQLTMCSREKTRANLFIVIEGADMLIPSGNNDLASLNDVQRRRIGIVQDWFSDPDFVDGGDSVCLIAESASLIHPRISKLPQVLDVEVSSPDYEERKHYIDWFCQENKPELWGSTSDLAALSAGLSVHSIRQLLKSATTTSIYKGVEMTAKDVVGKVESFIQHQIGEDVVEFKKPEHRLKDVVGFSALKKFIYEELIPRFQASGDEALPGAAVAGPIGCHKKGQKVIMYDGSLKKIEDVKKGEMLMGPDSKPRIINNLIRGEGKMYRIKPVKGKSFIVNEDHILSLVKTKEEKNEKVKYAEVSVKDYLDWSKWKRSIYKLYRVAVEFEEKELPIDPYFFGNLLGDGSMQHSPCVTNTDAKVIEEVYKQAKKFKLRVRVTGGDRCPSYYLVGKKKVKNPIAEILRSLDSWDVKCGDKFIPEIYKTSSKKQRQELLAGILDTDGSLGNCFEDSSKSKKLIKDVAFVARSLGFAAYPVPKKVNGKTYYRMSISGNLDNIPTRIKRKKAKPRKQKKSVLRTGFSLKSVGKGEFYGFSLDKDGLYLLDDFTVTHNSGKTFIFEAVAAELGMPVLVLKNIRSQWFGQTDVIFERLRRVLEALQKVVIFVDEADTQFGGVGKESHTTERRLTGKIQAMMSDPKLRGKVIWLLMTARIHLLSPDIRRPGRVGDLIIPVLDPRGEDREEFVDWVLSAIGSLPRSLQPDRCDDEEKQEVLALTDGYSAAAYASLRSYLKAQKKMHPGEHFDVVKIIGDQIPANIGPTREYQTLQALANCTRRSLIPDCVLEESCPELLKQIKQGKRVDILKAKAAWERKIKELEAQGIN